MDSQYATVDQLAEITDTMTSLRDAILGLGQRIDGHRAQPLPISGSTPHDSTPPPPPPPSSGPTVHQDYTVPPPPPPPSSGPTVQQDYTVPPPPPPLVQSSPQVGAFVLHGQTEATPHFVVAPAPIIDNTQARIDRLEQRIRSLHVSDGVIGWDGYDDLPVAAFPVEFRMPNIESYTGIGCPRIHLQLYNAVMRGHRLDEAQMIMLFPLSLSGAAQRWFASLDPSRRRTWADLGQEFIRQYSFNTVVDVSRRELEALRQRPDESVTSFISRWREKIAQIIDRPSERDQIGMIMRSLQPRFARHLMGFPQTDFGSLVQSLYGIEEGISRGLWADSSPSDSKGKKPGSGPRPSDVGAIGITRHRSPNHLPFQRQFSDTPYQMTQRGQYRPASPFRPVGPTYLHSPPQPVYATQAPQRPHVQYHQQYRAPPPPRPARQFTQLGMPLSRAFQRLVEGGLIVPLPPRPPPQPTPPGFRTDLHCAYHQRAGHDTENCAALKHAIQDLIDQGLVDLGRPAVTTGPLPIHDTRAVPPPSGGIHSIEFLGNEIFMMGWDGEAPQPICLYPDPDFSEYTLGQQVSRPFRLIQDDVPRQTIVSPVYLQHVPPMAPFIMLPEEYGPVHKDVQIVTRSGRIAQPPLVDRPFAGIDDRDEIHREDDEILRQLRTTQARISIWSLLASSSTHRDALIRALSQIRVDTATTPGGLIHFLTADRATCIVFSDDDLPHEGSDHVRPLFIDVACSGRRVLSVLLDNDSTLNVCPLVTAIALGFSPSDFGPSIQTIRAYDGTQRTVMGTLTTHVMIGPVRYSILFQVLSIQSSFNLLLGRPWIHEAGSIPSSLHQKVKFIHEGRIITIQSDTDVITSFEPVLQISQSENDLLVTGFVFDEVQVVSLEDDNRDMVPMSFDQHNSTLVLSMMRGMSYMPGLGLGRRQQGPREFTITVDHDISYGLGYIPTADDARHMARLRRERVRARMSGIPFDYPLRPYTFQLADYFIKESKYVPRTEGVDHVSKMAEIQGIQHALGHMCLRSETIDPPEAMIVAPPSPDRASVFSMCFPEEIPNYDLPMDLGDETDGVTLPDTYMDEMDMIGTGRFLDTASRGPHSALDMFGVSMIDSDAVTLYDACTDAMDMIGTGRILDVSLPGPRFAFDVFGISMLEFDDDGLVATDITHDTVSIEGASDSVDPPLSFDTMSGFVTRFDDISDGNNDMSIFEYSLVSHHFPLIAPPASAAHVYDVNDMGDTNDPPGGQSESNYDTEDKKVTLVSDSTEWMDFGVPD